MYISNTGVDNASRMIKDAEKNLKKSDFCASDKRELTENLQDNRKDRM